jgi:hypothetical protein
MKPLLFVVSLLSACGAGQSDRYLLWKGTGVLTQDRSAIVCVGEIDLTQGTWYCGKGGYTSSGSASSHGTVTVTPRGWVFTASEDPYTLPECGSPTPQSVPWATTALECGSWVLSQPWVSLTPPGRLP